MEKFTLLATNFTLPPALTGWTNYTSVGALLVGWLVVVARAVSRKTPIYFIFLYCPVHCKYLQFIVLTIIWLFYRPEPLCPPSPWYI